MIDRDLEQMVTEAQMAEVEATVADTIDYWRSRCPVDVTGPRREALARAALAMYRILVRVG